MTTVLFTHDSCYIKLCSPRKLVKEEKQSQNVVSEDESSFNSSTTVTNQSFLSPSKERQHCSIILKTILCKHASKTLLDNTSKRVLKYSPISVVENTSVTQW